MLDTNRAGDMQTESPVRRDLAPAPVGSDELAEGLMLVRASTLKMIRFQLAMERRDRRGALEAVDDLVALDRQLEHYLADAPIPAESLRRELEVERAALNREKLTLAAEVIHGGANAVPTPEPVAEESSEDVAVEVSPRRTAWWLAAIFVLL